MASRRLQNVTSSYNNVRPDDEVVVVAACRTPIGKARRGGFKDTHPIDLLVPVLTEVTRRGGIDKADVEDIVVGNVNMPGAGAAQWRMASLVAGYPKEVSVKALNRQCSSGLQAVADVAGALRCGFIKVGVAAGVESMSTVVALKDPMGVQFCESVGNSPAALACTNTMGQTSETVAKRYNVTRADQDQFSLESQQKALKAKQNGYFQDEIIAVKTKVKTEEGMKEVTVAEDEGVRATTIEGLNKLKPAFSPDGASTAGNSSQTSDGAAAVLLMLRSEAKARKLPVLGSIKSFAVAGVGPEEMGIGPAAAIPKALSQCGLTVNDIDVFEINEAFASQALYCQRVLGIPMSKLNPTGGAIALGHPLGCTGARMVSTLLYGLRRTAQRTGVISMCIGTGMGAAMILEAEPLSGV